MTETGIRHGGILARWRQLAPAGKRRIGEFVGNMILGAAASILTLVVLPGLTGRVAAEVWVTATGLLLAFGLAILSVFIRLITEEHEPVVPSKGVNS